MIWFTQCRICSKDIGVDKYDDAICSDCDSIAAKVDRAQEVITGAFDVGAEEMVPLLSGGHDSITAVTLASRHPKFDGRVYHIDTGIGCRETRTFVEELCKERNWDLRVYKSPSTYEMFIRERGFPGPAMHQYAYIRLKERCVRQIMRMHGKRNVALITGCRSQESERRMGHVEPLKIGEWEVKKFRDPRLHGKKTGKMACAKCFLRVSKDASCPECGAADIVLRKTLTVKKKIRVNRRRYWVAPCHDWSAGDQQQFMNAEDLPRNPIKMSPLGMSGECFCGAFAKPNEIELIRQYAPDVAAEIDRLALIAEECGKHASWGTRPDRKKGIVVAKSGPLCSSCDIRSAMAGIVVEQCDLFAALEP